MPSYFFVFIICFLLKLLGKSEIFETNLSRLILNGEHRSSRRTARITKKNAESLRGRRVRSVWYSAQENNYACWTTRSRAQKTKKAIIYNCSPRTHRRFGDDSDADHGSLGMRTMSWASETVGRFVAVWKPFKTCFVFLFLFFYILAGVECMSAIPTKQLHPCSFVAGRGRDRAVS